LALVLVIGTAGLVGVIGIIRHMATRYIGCHITLVAVIIVGRPLLHHITHIILKANGNLALIIRIDHTCGINSTILSLVIAIIIGITGLGGWSLLPLLALRHAILPLVIILANNHLIIIIRYQYATVSHVIRGIAIYRYWSLCHWLR